MLKRIAAGGAAAGVAVVLSPTAAFAQTPLTVEPVEAAVGDPIDVVGAGCEPEAPVDLFLEPGTGDPIDFDETPVVADAEGAFAFDNVAVPDADPGAFSLVAECGTDRFETDFEVLAANAEPAPDAALTLDPVQPVIGAPLTVTGAECPPGEDVAFAFQMGNATPLAAEPFEDPIVADDAGAFTGPITVPDALEPGPATLTATCGDVVQEVDVVLVAATTTPTPTPTAPTPTPQAQAPTGGVAAGQGGAADSAALALGAGAALIAAGAAVATRVARSKA